MADERVRDGVARALKSIAPEIDLAKVADDAELREALDIDSFDFLNFLMGLHKELGVEIPEADYGKIRTLGDLVTYLTVHTPTASR